MEFISQFIGLIVLGVIVVAVGLFIPLLFRRVVPTNEVHIVQSSKKTTSYGKDTSHGNTYYAWPSWLPVVGVVTRRLPTSVFDLDLIAYEAYDKGRLPFVVDVKAFFRINDSNVAAQRVESFQELQSQLVAIVQGAARVILASVDIEEILQGRSEFGDRFTREVAGHLQDWGVVNVKNIELMDIRDSRESNVIRNIMDKKKSHIEMESRTEVAKNQQAAQTAEIEAQKQVDLQRQEAEQTVGLRTTENHRQVQIADQQRVQSVAEQQKISKEREMEVERVGLVRSAEIAREASVIQAEQDREVMVINSEAEKQRVTLTAEGALEAKRREAEGILVEGESRAKAEELMQLAPVNAQITLAKEIGSNKEYQQYLVTIRQLEAAQAVGSRQADALEAADIKVITNAGSPNEGLTRVMDLFSAKGGTEVAGMLEALKQTEVGARVLDKLTGEPLQ